MQITKTRFTKRFNKWVTFKDKGKSNDYDDQDPVYGLIKLYAHHEDAIQTLERCRVNPDFNSTQRSDLEFYIPQICSLYMVGHINESQALVDLVCKSSGHSIFFSHRIWFFLQSLLYENTPECREHRNRSQKLLYQLKEMCIKSRELICLSNSQDLFNQIVKLGLLPFYPEFVRHQM